MHNESKYLLSKLIVNKSEEHGPNIKLIDYEHCDYIDDVLTEHFDIEYDYKIINDDTKAYILCFTNKITSEKVKKAVSTINNYHSSNKELYETI